MKIFRHAFGMGALIACAGVSAATPPASLPAIQVDAQAVLPSQTHPAAPPSAAPKTAAAIQQQKASKLQFGLAEVAAATRLQPRSLSAASLSASFPEISFSGKGEVATLVVNVTARRDAAAAAAVMKSLGATGVSSFGRMVSGRLPVTALDALGASAEVLSARANLVETNRGLYLTQGDYTLRTRFLRPAATGVSPGLAGGPTGLGMTVGVLSDSFDCRQTGVNQTATQDLASGEFSPVTVLKELPPGPGCTGTDEGRAMIQLVADVAPDSTQMFYTAFDGEADFAAGIVALRSAGATVTTDDVRYFDEPYFQDGIVAQAVDSNYDNGVLHFSSAGNSARQSYEAPFASAGAPPLIDPTASGPDMDFDPSVTVNPFNAFSMPAASRLRLALQWDEPYASATPGGPGSASDVDVFLLNAAGTVVAFSAAGNVGGDPFEFLDYTNTTGAAAVFRVVVEVYSGPVPGRIKWINYGTSTLVPAFNTNSGTIVGHTAAAGAFSTGAAGFFNTVECGLGAPDRLESFSSSGGGTPILFDTAGNRLTTPIFRQKPDAVGPDGGNTSFFIQVFTITPAQRPNPACQDQDLLVNNFFGTSAAAPHLAGVAALLKEAAPTATALQVANAMRNRAARMGLRGAVAGSPTSINFDSGYGFVRADAAYAALVDVYVDKIVFDKVKNAEPATQTTSNTATVSGLASGIGVPVTITGGQFSINGGAYGVTGTVVNGDTLTVRLTSSASFGGTAVATVRIGPGVVDKRSDFVVKTRAADVQPDPFSFGKVTGAALATPYTSAPVIVGGVEVPVPISVTNGTISIDGGAPVTSGTVSNGSSVTVDTTSSSLPNTRVSATVSIGSGSGSFIAVTGP